MLPRLLSRSPMGFLHKLLQTHILGVQQPLQKENLLHQLSQQNSTGGLH